jgi:hypothetical protein
VRHFNIAEAVGVDSEGTLMLAELRKDESTLLIQVHHRQLAQNPVRRVIA